MSFVMGKTSIQWTDESWNPVTGCTRVSEGCRNCYAFDLHDMRHAAYKNGKKVPEQYAKPFTEIQLIEDRLDTPLKRKKPTKWFVNSMSDLFHKDVPDWFIDEVLGVAALTPHHTYQILTKRPERAAEMLTQPPRHNGGSIFQAAFNRQRGRRGGIPDARNWVEPEWPLKNVWIGTSIEDQQSLEKRLPLLMCVPARVRFLSGEPLLGPLDFVEFARVNSRSILKGIHWVIVGGESGKNARPCNVDWVRGILHECTMSGVACFIKQLGSLPYTNHPGWDEPHEFNSVYDDVLELNDSHGGDWDEWPEDLRVREFPQPMVTGG